VAHRARAHRSVPKWALASAASSWWPDPAAFDAEYAVANAMIRAEALHRLLCALDIHFESDRWTAAVDLAYPRLPGELRARWGRKPTSRRFEVR
jgi:hypothetical protein